MLRWRKEENKDCVTTVMRSSKLSISVKVQDYFCWRVHLWTFPWRLNSKQLVEIEEDTATLNHTISCQDDEVSSAKITHYALVGSPSSNTVRV